uniref:Uncharacterized protein n=2 Tax=root TaxID=1 RepID=Q79DP9_STRGR|nr:open reading frame from 504-1302; first start codon at 622 [Plasmid pSG1]AAA98351.1 unknown [Streptomyces griseus]
MPLLERHPFCVQLVSPWLARIPALIRAYGPSVGQDSSAFLGEAALNESVRAALIPLQDLGVEPVEHGDAVPGAGRHLRRVHTRLDPEGYAGVAQGVGHLGEGRGRFRLGEHCGPRRRPQVAVLGGADPPPVGRSKQPSIGCCSVGRQVSADGLHQHRGNRYHPHCSPRPALQGPRLVRGASSVHPPPTSGRLSPSRSWPQSLGASRDGSVQSFSLSEAISPGRMAA